MPQQAEKWNRKSHANAVELLAPDIVSHVSGAPGPMNLEAFKQFVGPFDTGFSGSKHTTEALIAEGDRRLYLPNRLEVPRRGRGRARPICARRNGVPRKSQICGARQGLDRV
jgi:hypothetical protein